jgi:Tfp pilus assembly protein PilN
MSIMINLLPDVRQAKLRERRRRQLVSGVSVMVWAVCGGIIVLLAVYSTGQKVLIASLTGSIAKDESTMRGINRLPEALTAADHLSSLPKLYDQRNFFSKFFARYEQAAPTDVTLTSVAVDASNTLVVDGIGTSYASVAKLARALAASNVTLGSSAQTTNDPYFSSVLIANIASEGNGVTFTINAVVGASAIAAPTPSPSASPSASPSPSPSSSPSTSPSSSPGATNGN